MSENQSDLPKGQGNKKKSSSRETLYSKREQLLREMQSSDEVGPISVKDQIASLEKSSQPDLPDEDDWGSKKGSSRSHQWMLWVILGLAIPVFVIGTLLVVRRGNESGSSSGQNSNLDFDELRKTTQESPEDWFVENSSVVFSQAIQILETLSEPELALDQVRTLVRDDKQADLVIERKSSNQWIGFDTREVLSMTWEYVSSSGTGFFVLRGPRTDFSNFRAYFVRDGEKLRLDVDATEASSEVPVKELPGMVLEEPVLMRVWIAKEPNFDSPADGNSFSWYQILAPNLVDFVWAYTEAGSPLDEEIRAKLRYGKTLQTRIREFRGTVKLKKSGRRNPDEFILDELVTSEWLIPN